MKNEKVYIVVIVIFVLLLGLLAVLFATSSGTIDDIRESNRQLEQYNTELEYSIADRQRIIDELTESNRIRQVTIEQAITIIGDTRTTVQNLRNILLSLEKIEQLFTTTTNTGGS